MNLPSRPTHLYAWTCPHCFLGIRTREYLHTMREARWHAWDLHRAGTIGLPCSVLWDPRIEGKRVLFTEWTGGEV